MSLKEELNTPILGISVRKPVQRIYWKEKVQLHIHSQRLWWHRAHACIQFHLHDWLQTVWQGLSRHISVLAFSVLLPKESIKTSRSHTWRAVLLSLYFLFATQAAELLSKTWIVLSPLGHDTLSECNLTWTKRGLYCTLRKASQGPEINIFEMLCKPDVQTLRWHCGRKET